MKRIERETDAGGEHAVVRVDRPPSAVIGAAHSSYLDVCRGTAASLVVFAHAQDIFGYGSGYRAYGALGVAIFFLLSGFLIAISINGHLARDNPQLSSFLSDRVARIATPFLPVLCLVALVNSFLALGNWGQFGVNRGVFAFLGNALLLHDYPLVQALSNKWNVADYYVRSYNTAEPFWTIPIEFWIYVGVGVFAFGIFGRRRIRFWFGLAAIAISAPVIVWNSFAGGGRCLALIWFTGAGFGGLWMFLRRRLGERLWPVGFSLAAFGGISLIGRAAKISFDPFDLQTSILLACVLFGISFSLEGSRERRWFQLLGSVLSSYSYSLYLVHNTVLIIAYEYGLRYHLKTYFAAILAAHLVAIAVYLLFERHYRVVSLKIRPALAALCSDSASIAASKVPADHAAGRSLSGLSS